MYHRTLTWTSLVYSSEVEQNKKIFKPIFEMRSPSQQFQALYRMSLTSPLFISFLVKLSLRGHAELTAVFLCCANGRASRRSSGLSTIRVNLEQEAIAKKQCADGTIEVVKKRGSKKRTQMKNTNHFGILRRSHKKKGQTLTTMCVKNKVGIPEKGLWDKPQWSSLRAINSQIPKLNSGKFFWAQYHFWFLGHEFICVIHVPQKPNSQHLNCP